MFYLWCRGRIGGDGVVDMENLLLLVTNFDMLWLNWQNFSDRVE